MEAERERTRAQEEQQKAEAALQFLVQDVIGAADPYLLNHDPTLVEMLQAAAPKVAERFGSSPAVELQIRTMLADAFLVLGRYSDAEREMRRSLELRRADPESTPLVLGRGEWRLGRILVSTGDYAEAEGLLRSAISRLEPLATEEPTALAGALDDLGKLLMQIGRAGEAIALLERALELGTDSEADELATRDALATALLLSGRFDEAETLFDEALAAQIALGGEHTDGVAAILTNRSSLYLRSGRAEEAAADLRRAYEIELEIFGPDHPETARAMGALAQVLVDQDQSEEAEKLGRRGLEIVRRLTPHSIEVANQAAWLGRVLTSSGKEAEAEPLLAEALGILTEVLGPDNDRRLTCANSLGVVLAENGKLDEAGALLDDVLARRRRGWGPASGECATTLHAQASLCRKRGDLEGAVERYEEAIAILEPLGDRERLATTLYSYAVVLRQMGDADGAAELDLRASELEK